MIFRHDRDSLYFKPDPIVLRVAEVGPEFQFVTISDIEVADFDGDGERDLAVAWFATDTEHAERNVRRLVIYRLRAAAEVGLEFSVMADLDLYIADPEVPALSIFRNGTAEIGTGDFDGDGDIDLAVHAFFGDELWFVENLGGGAFQQYLQFPFYVNSPGNFITPPESLSADFDGDGRDELVYIADPVLQIGGQIIHFWKTEDTIANMYRVDWDAFEEPIYTQWTRGLAIGDFDGDGRPDLCFSGTMNPPDESGPILTVWYGLNTDTREFHVYHAYPRILCSDVAAVRPDLNRNCGVILSDLDGTRIQYWRGGTGSEVSLTFQSECTGFAGLAPGRGMTLITPDVNGDGLLDVVTKQKHAQGMDPNQVQIAQYAAGTWARVSPEPLDSRGFDTWSYDQILRPRNLAAADVTGNALPELFAAFGPSGGGSERGPSENRLEVAIWENSCVGDVNGDGWVGTLDMRRMDDALGSREGDTRFNINADLDKDGRITLTDFGLLVDDAGCVACGGVVAPCAGQKPGDSNCDGVVNTFDIDAFVAALVEGEARWRTFIGAADCSFLCVNDADGSARVDVFDIDLFIECMIPSLEAVRGH